jgi:hypothetical protein
MGLRLDGLQNAKWSVVGCLVMGIEMNHSKELKLRVKDTK